MGPYRGNALATARVMWSVGLLLAAAISGTALGQDTHYWTEQYGNRARLLGGAVIGSSSDLSSVYYNPGRLALVTSPELLLAGNVFEYSVITLKEEQADQNIKSSRFSLTPSLFAGEFRFGWLGDSRLAYSFLTRNSSEFNTQGRTSTLEPNLPAANLDFLADSIRVDQKMTEYWGGVTWAKPVGPVGFGISTFVAARNQRGLVQRTTLGAFDGTPAAVQGTDEYRYNHWRALWKIGAGAKVNDWDMGLTITTPGLKLFGGGEIAGDRSGTGIPGDPGLLIFMQQDDLAATYKSPWSVALGGSRTFEQTEVHLGIEWFAPVGLYDVLPGELVTPIVGGQPTDPTVRHESAAVLNASAGVAHTFNDRLSGYASLRTDFSSAVDESVSNLAFTEWNLYHLSAGATVRTDSVEFTTGAIVAFGSSNSPPRIESVQVDSSYFRITAILGFSFGFADLPQGQ